MQAFDLIDFLYLTFYFLSLRRPLKILKILKMQWASAKWNLDIQMPYAALLTVQQLRVATYDRP